MKIIDLLNKIANGEELPKKIRYEEEIWELDPLNRTYDNSKCCLFEDYIDKKYIITDVLNDKVEIIGEDKKIKRILTYTTLDDEEFAYEDGDKPHNVCINSPIEKLFIKKIDEIIDKLNEAKDE